MLLLAGCGTLPPPARPGVTEATRVAACEVQTARLRGLAWTNHVPVVWQSPGELGQFVRQELAKPDNRAELHQTELMYRALGLLPASQDLATVLESLLIDQVAAYYDTDAKRIVCVQRPEGLQGQSNRNTRELLDRFVWVHEMTHALDDQHVDLEGHMKGARADHDASLAFESVAEGSAILLGLDGVLQGGGAPATTASPISRWLVGLLPHAMDLPERVGPGAQAELAALTNAPPMVTAALLFPYLYGARFVNAVRVEQGWRGVDQLYDDPPVATAQLAHPRGHLQTPRRLQIDLPGPTDARWTCVSTNTVGALGIQMWLKRSALPGDWRASEGWLGDRLALWQDGVTNRVGWVSVWERTGQARRFATDCRRKLRAQPGAGGWLVVRRGTTVAAVWNMPDPRVGEAAATALLASRITGERPSWLASVSDDIPWPVRVLDGPKSVGVQALGGHLLVGSAGQGFGRLVVADGLVLNAEGNPDRCAFGIVWGLMRYESDWRADYTAWRIPLLASWNRLGQGADERYAWSVLWGLLASGTRDDVHVLLVPVWRAARR